MSAPNGDLRGITSSRPITDSKLGVIKTAIGEDHLLAATLHPYAIRVGSRSISESDMLKRDLLTSFGQTGWQEDVDTTISDHAVLKQREPDMRVHLCVRAKTLNLEISEADPLCSEGSAKFDTHRRGRVTGTSKRQVPHAMADAVIGSVIKSNGRPYAVVCQIDHVSRQSGKQYGFMRRIEYYWRRKYRAFGDNDLSPSLR